VHPNCLASLNLSGFISIPIIRLAPESLQPNAADNPIAPRPQMAHEESEFGIFQNLLNNVFKSIIFYTFRIKLKLLDYFLSDYDHLHSISSSIKYFFNHFEEENTISYSFNQEF
jgi:hypothetical protein